MGFLKLSLYRRRMFFTCMSFTWRHDGFKVVLLFLTEIKVPIAQHENILLPSPLKFNSSKSILTKMYVKYQKFLFR